VILIQWLLDVKMDIISMEIAAVLVMMFMILGLLVAIALML
jgi:hypothetical protein